MNKIDLNDIAMKFIEARPHYTKLMIARAVAKEAIYQALVLASENAEIIQDSAGNPMINKQSILSIEELIV